MKIDPVSNTVRYQWDDIGMSILFADVFGEVCRYNTTAKEYSVYNGTTWETDKQGMHVERFAKILTRSLIAYSCVRDCEKPYQDFVQAYSKRSKRTTLIQDARDQRHVREEDFDKDGKKLNCLNGTLTLGDTHTIRTT